MNGKRNRFEWDAKKAVVNLKKHGVGFESAIAAFDDALAVTVPDPDHSDHKKSAGSPWAAQATACW